MRQPHPNDLVQIYNPMNKEFKFKWNKVEYVIPPKTQTTYLRFIAEHCAKHLADFILQFKEYTYKQQFKKEVNLVRNKAEREKVINMIILGVQTWFITDSDGLNHVENFKPDDSGMELGTIDNDMMGHVFDGLEVEPVAEAIVADDKITKNQIIEQLNALGINHDPSESKAELLKKMKVV